jgi:hypothetical protein
VYRTGPPGYIGWWNSLESIHGLLKSLKIPVTLAGGNDSLESIHGFLIGLKIPSLMQDRYPLIASQICD